jgi:hypothetical protein
MEAWVGILQQQEEDDGKQSLSTLRQLRYAVEALWSVCAGATLVSCRFPEGELYSRCTPLLGLVCHEASTCTPMLSKSPCVAIRPECS